MRAWISTAVLLTACIAGKPAFAGAYCGQWGGNEVRCLASNGLTSEHPGGLSTRNYLFTLTVKPEYSRNYKISLDRWGSVCGFPGFHTSSQTFQYSPGEPLHVRYDDRVGHLMCMEYFVHQCEAPIDTPKPCGDVVDTTIR